MQRSRIVLIAAAAAMLAGGHARAQSGNGDPIGIYTLRAYDPSLTGSGVIVAQPEAIASGSDGFEVNPSYVGVPSSKFVYISASGTATSFPNSVGSESSHADVVGGNLYGMTNTINPEGVAYGVSQIYNYDANYFYNTLIANQTAIPAGIVNQSFVFTSGTYTEAEFHTVEQEIDQDYDWYAARYGTLFVSGVGTGGEVLSPGISYNGIGVGVSDAGTNTSTGPTFDGRSKPDIVAPGSGADSFAVPKVSGAAAILLQAAKRGDGGFGTATAASDARTLKALLLNGAVKPAGWSHTSTTPLDPTYGAGILNVYTSYMNLRAGKVTPSLSGTGSAHSVSVTTTLASEGWDLSSVTNTLKNGKYLAETNYYEFTLTDPTGAGFTLTSTLVWDLQDNQTAINNLYLYLFNADTGTQIAISDSTVDNVQQLYVQNLPAGDYDIEVMKTGTSGPTSSETYALAYNFAPLPEPSAWWLAGIAAPLLWAFRRRSSYRSPFASPRNGRIFF